MSAVTRPHPSLSLFHAVVRAFAPARVSAPEKAAEVEVARAVRELRGSTDRELVDLGIIRDEIEEVVRHGRRGIERPAS